MEIESKLTPQAYLFILRMRRKICPLKGHMCLIEVCFCEGTISVIFHRKDDV